MATLFHVHDPMCSWCWGFKPVWNQVKESLPDSLTVKHILGGLAPDSAAHMPEQMQQMLQQTWKRIEQTIPGTRFNYAFWTENKPRRSTYPACRAVLAASAQQAAFEDTMTTAIQHAYYLDAKNPSDDDVLIQLAGAIGCNTEQFAHDINSDETKELHRQHQNLMQQIGAQGFPSLFIVNEQNMCSQVPLDYNDANVILDRIETFLAS